MSKFAVKLRNVSESPGAPIGFHASVSEARRPAMLLVVGLLGKEGAEARILADVNADGGLILGEGTKAQVVRQIVQAAGDIPVGISAKAVNEDRINELVSSGCDFMVLDTRAPAAILHKEGLGKLLLVEPSSDQGLVRAINSLEVDGVVVANRGGDAFLTLEQVLISRRFVELVEKPVIVALPSLVSKRELASLWQAGVDGIVTPSTQSVQALTELRKSIADLPGGARRRRARIGVILPRYGESTGGEEDEEQEED